MILYPLTHEEYILLVQSVKCKIDGLEIEIDNLNKKDKSNEYIKRCIEKRYTQIYKLQSILINLKIRHDAL